MALKPLCSSAGAKIGDTHYYLTSGTRVVFRQGNLYVEKQVFHAGQDPRTQALGGTKDFKEILKSLVALGEENMDEK